MNHREEYWKKIGILHHFKKNYQRNLIKKEETLSILRAVDLCLENQEILEGACYVYLKNKLIRYASCLIIRFFINQYQKYTPVELEIQGN